MVFANTLTPDARAVFAALGYPASVLPDATAAGLVQAAGEEAQKEATPRWVWRQFALLPGGQLAGTDVALPGRDMEVHLAGCPACVLLAVTLGPRVEDAIRAAEAADMRHAVALDAAASVLAEQYAQEAETLLRGEQTEKGMFATGRFSPGYGDFPLVLQQDILRLLDAPRKIGLSVSGSGLLLPRKSITAVLGVADHPVGGQLAGCAQCSLAEKCERKQRGGYCGKTNF